MERPLGILELEFGKLACSCCFSGDDEEDELGVARLRFLRDVLLDEGTGSWFTLAVSAAFDLLPLLPPLACDLDLKVGS